MRGKEASEFINKLQNRITPAYAGKSAGDGVPEHWR